MKITIVKPGFEIFTSAAAMREIMPLLERAGRTCYKSEDKASEDSAASFIRRIIKSGHESVIEHASITVKIICSRSCSHQLVRHRIAAYSQESQRYCDYGKKGLQVICPPEIADLVAGEYFKRDLGRFGLLSPSGEWIQLVDDRAQTWLYIIEQAYGEYAALRRMGVPPEDARSVLPNATKTEVVTTFNLRQWRHVFKMRAFNKHAQWEIRQVMRDIHEAFILCDLAPIFGDLADDQ